MSSEKMTRTHRHHYRRKALLGSTSILCSILLVGELHAQSSAPIPPVRSPIDENGVNLASGQIVLTAPSVSIGTADRSLSFGMVFNGASWNHNFNVAMKSDGSNLIIIFGGNSEKMTLSNGVYSSSSGNGSTLVSSGTGNYVYTMRDGTIINFSSSILPPTDSYDTNWYGIPSQGGGQQIVALPTSMISPNGETINFYYKKKITQQLYPDTYDIITYNYFRLQSVKSSSGYQIKFGYDSNDASATWLFAGINEWATITSATAINASVDYCDPNADTCSSLTQAWPSVKMTYANSGSNVVMTVKDANGGNTVYNTTPKTTLSTYTLRPNSAQRPSGIMEVDNISYDASGFITSLTKGGVNYSYSFSQSGGATSSTMSGPSGQIRSATADIGTGSLSRITDAFGNTTSYIQDTYGRVTQVTHPDGQPTDYTSASNYETFTYDARGNVTQMTIVPKLNSGLSNITLSAGYDATCTIAVKCNKPNWTKDALGNETDYTYDATTGLVTSVTAPAATASGIRPQTRYTYTPMQAYFKNAAGSIVASGTNTYVLTATAACRTNAGATLSGTAGQGPFSLSGGASCAGTSDELKTMVGYGSQSTGTANNLLPVSQTVSAGDGSASMTTSQSYDTVGNIATSVGPLGSSQTSVSRYDANRRLLGTVSSDPDGDGPRTPTAVKYTYNADGVVTQTQVGTVTDQSDSAWTNFTEVSRTTQTLDGNGRVIRSSVGSGGTTYALSDYLYDSLGRPSCSIQYMNPAAWGTQATSCLPLQTSGPNGPDRVTQTGYDANGRVLTVTEGVGTGAVSVTQTNAYNPNGTLAYVVDANSNRTSYTYDGFDRLIRTNFPPSTKGANASNSGDYVEVQSYDANGHVLQSRLRDGNTIGFTYDNLGRLALRTPQTNQTYPYDYPVNYDYNLIGQQAHITRSGVTLTYTYDNLGRLKSEGQPFGSVGYDYDGAGNRKQITWSDGFYVTYDYDTQGNVIKIKENGVGTGVNLLASYGYDSLGRRTSVAFGNGTSRTYAWDSMSRLAGLQQTFPNAAGSNQTVNGACSVNAAAAICYNPSSQITSLARSNNAYLFSGVYNINRTYGVNGLNQYTTSGSVALGYDARGNLNASGASSFTYSKQNELISAPNATFYYDPAGRLLEYDTASSTRFYYSGADLLAEVDSGSNILRRYVPGPGTDEPIVWYEGSGTSDRRFLQADERGSITTVTDSSGSLLGLNTYDEFGIPASTNIGRFGYTGQAWFPEVGLYNYKARWYSPTLGRFMQTDPIGYGDGLNWYNYAHGDPINGKDPSGQWVVEHAPLHTNPATLPIAIAFDVAQLLFGFGLFGGGAAATPAAIINSAPSAVSPSDGPQIVVNGTKFKTLASSKIAFSSMSAASIAEAANAINPQEIQVEGRLGQGEDGEIVVRGGAVLTPVAGNEWDSGLSRDIEELKKMLEEAKNSGNTALAKRIIKQLKVAGARNASKLRGLGRFRFGPPLLVPDWLLTDPCAFSPAIPVCVAKGMPGV